MMAKRWLAGAAVLLAAGGAVALAVGGRPDEAAIQTPAKRSTLALLTSLPLVFGESFALDNGGSPVLTRLEQRYNVVPIGVADAASLRGHELVLMAHPRAQPAEALVELDQWVRDGGRVLLLADPMLSWDSARPIGDPLRPPPAFADTGLLGHWGVELLAERAEDLPVETPSPGMLASKRCKVADGGFIARCKVGKGRATIIADADFLNGGPKGLDLMTSELAHLERP
jgi:hypothetical protein